MNSLKIVACIPERYAATRFPAKLMQLLGDKTVIRTTYENTVATGLFDDVIVVTDSDIIFQEITTHGGKAIMSLKEHESGSDRIAEAIEHLELDVVVNVQGDEPFVNKTVLEKLVGAFADPSVEVASVMHPSSDAEYLSNPNFAKVVVDKDSNALYFSRALIPFDRQSGLAVTYFKHIGIYAFRKKALLAFTTWPMGKLEQIEKLEQLRYLENGIKIRMVVAEYSGIGIDTPAELDKARQMLGK